MTNLTTLPNGPHPLEERAAEATLMLDHLRSYLIRQTPADAEELASYRTPRIDADEVVLKAAEEAKELHRRIYAHILTGEPERADLVMEFIGSVMAADVEARIALEIDSTDTDLVRWMRALVAACWAAALNWGVPVEHQR
jgi:hypothetical protein